jgi:ABC-type transport system involved in multi-copper enzyme maturation permease subunit
VTDPSLLPDADPVAWRETSKRTLGRARYLFRILICTEIPLVLLCGLLSLSAMHEKYSMIPRIMGSMLMLALWALAVLIVSVQSASLIAAERSHQTLDVLCTAPLTGREIVLQKFRAVRRLILVLAAPFSTLAVFEAWLRVWIEHKRYFMAEQFSPLFYLMCQVLAVAIYLPLVAWLSLAIGLKVRTQPRAIVGSMAAIVAWCVAPFIFIVIPLAISFQGRGPSHDPVLSCTMLLSPASIIFWNEFNTDFVWREFGENLWVPVVLNFGVYLAALVFFRRVCLRNADRWLGRLQETTSPDSPAAGGGPLAALRTWLGTMERGVQPETRAEQQ